MTLLTVGLAVIVTYSSKAQLVTSDATNSAQVQSVVNALKNPKGGVTISNISWSAYGSSVGETGSAIGSFSSGSSFEGLNSGMILSTGKINNVIGPNYVVASGTNLNRSGDADISMVMNGVSKDAAVVEFDVVVSGNTLSLQYLFASEEYPEKVCTSLNDAFAILISGPGINGKVNIADVPGFPGVPVGINTVNNGIGNAPGANAANCPMNYAQGFVSNPPGQNNNSIIQYDGHTILLEASASVQPCQTYHVKIVIADGGDALYDSGILFKAGSLSSEILTITPSGSTSICGNETVVLSVPQGYFSYQWKKNGVAISNANSYTYTAANAGTYTVEVKKSYSSPLLISEDLTVQPAANIQSGINATTLNLCASPSGITLTAAHTTGTFKWTPGNETTRSISISTPGIYSVEVEENGCKRTSSVTVRGNTMTIQTDTVVHVSCYGNNDGAIHISVVDKTSTFTYQWTKASSSFTSSLQNLCCLTAGIYTVTVTDADGCVKTKTEEVTQPTELIVTAAQIEGTGGSVEASASGSVPPYTYSWKNSSGLEIATTEDIDNLEAGSYTLTVKDSRNCTKQVAVTITGGCQATSFYNVTNASCVSTTDGAIALTVSNLPGTITYSWTGPEGYSASSNNIANLRSGIYQYVAINEEQCKATGTVVVGAPAFTAVASVTNPLCNGASSGSAVAIVNGGGTEEKTYSWKNGNNEEVSTSNSTGQILAAGTYSLYVTNPSTNCTASSTFIVTQPEPLTITITSADAACYGMANGSIATLTAGGTAPYNYSWTGPGGYISSAAQPTGLVAGDYTLVLTDSRQCTAQYTPSSTVTVGQPAQIVLAVTPGSVTGQASVDVISGGVAEFTYLWSNQAATKSVKGLRQGTQYTVTVTGQDGCSASANYTPANGCQMTASLGSIQAMSCYATTNGSIDVLVSGGGSTLTYSWTSPSGFTSSSEDLTGLANGVYQLTVTDENGCTASVSATIERPLELVGSLTDVQITCNGLNNGSITTTVSGGTPGAAPAPNLYLFSWKKDGMAYATTKNLSNLAAGLYELEITDAKNCKINLSKTIAEPILLTANAIGSNITCFGNTDGKVTLEVAGGTTPYTFVWTKQGGGFTASTQNIENLIVGTYNVLATDARGCTASSSATIIAPGSDLVFTLDSKTDLTCAGASNGTASVTATGGYGSTTYAWKLFGNLIPSTGTQEDQTALKAGDYTVYATDAGGCVRSLNISITEPTPPSIVLSGAANICEGQSVVLSSSQTGTIYSWYFNDQTTAVSTDPTYTVSTLAQTGYYKLSVTKSNGCVESADPVQVSVNPKPLATITAERTNFCQGNMVALNAKYYPDGIYTWKLNNSTLSTPSPANMLMATSAGTYTLDIVTPICASEQSSVTLNQHTPFTINTSVTNATCSPSNNGAITASATGQYGTVTWDWAHISGSSDPASISGLADGFYTVIATDEAGCMVTEQVTVLDTELNVQNTVTNVSCKNGTNGSINLNVTYNSPNPSGNCYTGTPTSSYSCSSGCTQLSGSNWTGISTGQTYCIPAGQTFSGGMSLDGGTLIICGTLQNGNNWVGFNSGTIIINPGGKIITGQWFYMGSNITFRNYGEFSSTTGMENSSAVFENYGSITISGIIKNTNGGKIFNYSTITASSFENNNALIENYGTIATTTFFHAQNASVTNNYCTFSIGTNLEVNNNPGGTPAILNNHKTINVTGITRVIQNGVLNQQAGSRTETYDLDVSGGIINGIGGSCSAVKINQNTYLSNNAQLLGQTGLCPANTIIGNQYTAGAQVTLNCSCTANGGGAPVTCSIQWSGPGLSGNTTGNSLSNLGAGTYVASITCDNCSKQFSYTITEPSLLEANVEQIFIPDCFGQTNGGIDISVTGGTPFTGSGVAPYTYLWSGSSGFTSTTQDISNAGAGNYTVVIKDKNNCTITLPVITISQPAELTASVVCSGGPSCMGASNGSAYANVAGGTQPFTYTWTKQGDPTPLTQSSGPAIGGLPAGTYQLLVKDFNNCEATATVVVPEAQNDCITGCTLELSLTAQDANCTTEQNGVIFVTVTGQSGALNYDWSHLGGPDNPASAGFLLPGTYSLKLTDSKGCKKEQEIVVGAISTTCTETVVCELEAEIVKTNVSCPESADGTVSVSGKGANGTIKIDWLHISGSENSLDLSGLAVGSYSGSIVDEEGCTAPVSVVIENKVPVAIYNSTNVVCPQNPVTLASSYSTGNTWSTGATTQQIVVTLAGTYTLTVALPGCSQTLTRQIEITEGTCTTRNVTCDPPPSVEIEIEDQCKSDELAIAFSNASTRYLNYLEDLKENFRTRYTDHCINAEETLTAEYGDNEHHYTLYYYDQAGNLVRTVPPKGVVPLSPADALQAHEDYKANQRTVYTDHTLTSTYTYNSLNQLIGQNIPDHDPMDLTRIATGSDGLDGAYTVSGAHFASNGEKGFILAHSANEQDGKIYFTQDGGKTWSELSTVTTENINDVEIISSTIMHAVGNKGSYLVSTDGGQRWILKETGIAADLIQLHYFSATEGILFDRTGNSYQTLDGGDNWTMTNNAGNLKSLLTQNNSTLTDIHYTTSTEVYASSKTAQTGFLYKSTNGGYTWSTMPNIKSTSAVLTTSMPASHIMVAATARGYMLSSSNNGADWKMIASSSNQTYLKPIRFRSATQGVREIADGTYLATTDGGVSWNAVTSSGGFVLSGILDLPSQRGYAIRNNNSIRTTTNGGFDWTNIGGVPNAPSGTTCISGTADDQYVLIGYNGKIQANSIGGIPLGGGWTTIIPSYPGSFAAIKIIAKDLKNGNVLFADGSVFHYNTDAAPNIWSAADPLNNSGYADIVSVNNDYLAAYKASGKIIYSIDGGVTWTERLDAQLPVSGTQPFAGLSIARTSTNLVATVGDAAGEIYRNDDLAGTGVWQSAASTLKPLPINSVSMNSTGVGIAGGDQAILLKTVNGGVNWSIEPISATTGLNLSTSITEVTQFGTAVVIGAANGSLLSSSDDGSSFANNTVTGTTKIQKVGFNNSGRIFALNGAGKIQYKSSIGQNNWAIASVAGVTDPLYDLVFTSSDVAIISGGGGKMIRSDNSNAGTPLFVNTTNSDAPVLYASHMPVENVGYAVGKTGVVVKTINGGAKWTELNSGTNQSLYAVNFLDVNKGVIAGEAFIGITANGGADNFAAVTRITPASLTGYSVRDAEYLDASHIFLAGVNGAAGFGYATADGGLNYTSYTFPEPIYSLDFFNSIDGIAAGRSSTIYKIKRNNNTYTISPVTIPVAAIGTKEVLNVYMVDTEVWYVVGENGLLLRTDNAGVNWIDLNNAQIATDLSFITPRPDGRVAIGGNSGTVIYLTDERSRFTDKFWYDELGRLVASQNSKQNNFTPKKGYSYTLYDGLGRITEVGEVLTSHDIIEVINNKEASQVNYKKFSEVFMMHNGNIRRQITKTFYDVPKYSVPGFTQTELRNRVASIIYSEQDQQDGYDHATHYAYDIHGNVKTLIQDNAKLAADYPSFAANRYKRVDYSYDLISGNVHQVSYQKGLEDQFYHKYEYDADNRITNVYTSRDGALWERDAKYFYYRHGPLARTEIGNDKVQAMDYAYTLQGWIKGVNSNILFAKNDIGKDGNTTGTNLNRYVGTDAAGYSLNYYGGDYSAIGSIADIDHFVASMTSTSNVTSQGVGQDLFNGNISSMATAIHISPAAGNTNPLSPQGLVVSPQLTAYKYDQLNRIKQLKAYRDVNIHNTNSWANAVNNSDYEESYVYDANGNIMNLNRKGIPTTQVASNSMDELSYVYENIGNGYKRNTNRLRAVQDAVTNNAAANLGDIQPGQTYNNQDPAQSNYDYDNIGNLIKDASEQIANIEWTVYGKVKKVIRMENSVKPDLEFLYDASGNRIAKIVKPAATKENSTTWTTTWYVRDAQGNTLTTYEQTPPVSPAVTQDFKTDEFTLYGSSRLGTRGSEATITFFQQENTQPQNPNVEPPVTIPGACDVEMTDNNAIYSIKHGQRGIIPQGTDFTGKIIQEGGTLIVEGNFDAGTSADATNKYTYLGGEILVKGTLKGYSLNQQNPIAAVFYDFCNYNASATSWAVGLPVGTYSLAQMTAAGIQDDDLESIKVNAGYKVTIYEHDFGGEFRTYTSNKPCLEDEPLFNDKVTSIVIEKLTTGLVESSCAPSGTTANVIHNYGTLQYHDTYLSAGVKVNNYGLYNTQEVKLANNVEFNNFGTVNSSFFEVTASTATINQKAASILNASVLNVYGKVTGDENNYSSVLTSTANMSPNSSMTGLIKFCSDQLTNNGTIAASVVQDCAFEIPGAVVRATIGYEVNSGLKRYEFSNHLGNVLTTLSDRRIGIPNLSNPNIIDHYTAVILSSSDYYAFGSEMPGRGIAGNQSYRYGFNGKENDVESGWQDYGERMYNPNIARFFSVDPLTKQYPWYTPYQFAGNDPLRHIDLDGLEPNRPAAPAAAPNAVMMRRPVFNAVPGNYVILNNGNYQDVGGNQLQGNFQVVNVRPVQVGQFYIGSDGNQYPTNLPVGTHTITDFNEVPQINPGVEGVRRPNQANDGWANNPNSRISPAGGRALKVDVVVQPNIQQMVILNPLPGNLNGGFAPGSPILNAALQPAINAIAAVLANDPNVTAQIIANTTMLPGQQPANAPPPLNTRAVDAPNGLLNARVNAVGNAILGANPAINPAQINGATNTNTNLNVTVTYQLPPANTVVNP